MSKPNDNQRKLSMGERYADIVAESRPAEQPQDRDERGQVLQAMADAAQDCGIHPDRINAVCDYYSELEAQRDALQAQLAAVEQTKLDLLARVQQLQEQVDNLQDPEERAEGRAE